MRTVSSALSRQKTEGDVYRGHSCSRKVNLRLNPRPANRSVYSNTAPHYRAKLANFTCTSRKPSIKEVISKGEAIPERHEANEMSGKEGKR